MTLVALASVVLLCAALVGLILMIPARDRGTAMLIAVISIAVLGGLLLEIRRRAAMRAPVPVEVLQRASRAV